VHRHVHDVIAAIAPHDSVERFTGLGCTVLQAHARFIDDRTVEAGGQRIRAHRFVVATGSRAAVPPIPGLDGVAFFTNETLFDNAQLPEHLMIIGAGPIGCEMAQAHRRLGARVSVLDIGPMLPKDDPELVAIVRKAFAADGITLADGVKIQRVERREAGIAVVLADGNGERVIEASHLLIAAGRRPNVEDLGLEAAGVRYGPKGVEVDRRLRTSNKRVYAAGDVASGYQFTHLAAYHAGIVLRNTLFRLPAKVDTRALPWVTYTDPELAHVGLTEAQARGDNGTAIRVLRAEFADNDRAQAERATEGLIKVVVSKRGHVLGATIVGAHAGELILPWVLAIGQRLKIGTLAGMIAPYPTLSEISKRVAGSFYTPTLFGPRTRTLVRLLRLLG
jgi:pyruvate/2-oxoglutarate dehydrogenase complex dihydrolipoamide dehydrogenase (E3) component